MQYVIVFAILLLFLILFLQNKPIIEALTNEEDSSPQEKYQQYANNNTMILAEKNAANIEYLKSRGCRLPILTTLNKLFPWYPVSSTFHAEKEIM